MTPPPADCGTCQQPLKIVGRNYYAPMIPGFETPPRLICWECWFAEGTMPGTQGTLL